MPYNMKTDFRDPYQKVVKQTVKRFDENESPFSLWSRKTINSHLTKFRVYDIDYVWWLNHSPESPDGPLMFIEEKCKDAMMQPRQAMLMKRMNDDFETCKRSKEFFGFHLLRFENTGPQDGMIFLDEKPIDIKELETFLRFASEKKMYRSWFKKLEEDFGSHWTHHVKKRNY